MSAKEYTCPSCRSPLIGEAMSTGKCQCCGHRFDPEALRRAAEKSQAKSESS